MTRNLSPTARNYLASRKGTVAHILLWIAALNRVTGAVETLGLWTGDDDRPFSINGGARLYHAGGAAKAFEPIRYQTGVGVVTQRIVLSEIVPAVLTAIRGYDPRFAPVQIHRALFWPESGDLVEEPHRLFRGFIDQVKISKPEKGGSGSVELTLQSSARALTLVVPSKRSDASLTERAPEDGFRRYGASKGKTLWGPGAR